jgi:hypothetical protein
MKTQDIIFLSIVVYLIVYKKQKYFPMFGLGSLLLSIGFFASWIFFTAERLTWYAAGFFFIGIIYSMTERKELI